jgi:hypothetical protein
MVLATLLAAGASSAFACGVCVEDKIAAVYDHATVIRALEAKDTVVFFAIEGAIPPGVDRQSVRISREVASMAVSFDPRRAELAKVQETLDRRLAAMGLSLLAMREMSSPGDLATVRRPR